MPLPPRKAGGGREPVGGGGQAARRLQARLFEAAGLPESCVRLLSSGTHLQLGTRPAGSGLRAPRDERGLMSSHPKRFSQFRPPALLS